MPGMGIFDKTMGLLQKVMDLRLQNQQVVSSNIANAETPGYAPARMDFEKSLEQAASGPSLNPVATRPGHITIGSNGVDGVQGKIVRIQDKSGIGDGNGVDVDQEMAVLAENQIMYDAATQMINKKLATLKYVATDGR